MSNAVALSLEQLAAANARSAALNYVSEAFAEAALDGIDVEAFAEAALCAAFRELVAVYGEDRAVALAKSLPERLRSGEFSTASRQ